MASRGRSPASWFTWHQRIPPLTGLAVPACGPALGPSVNPNVVLFRPFQFFRFIWSLLFSCVGLMSFLIVLFQLRRGLPTDSTAGSYAEGSVHIMFLVHVTLGKSLKFESFPTDIASKLFQCSVPLLMFTQVPLVAGFVITLGAGVRLLVWTPFPTMAPFTNPARMIADVLFFSAYLLRLLHSFRTDGAARGERFFLLLAAAFLGCSRGLYYGAALGPPWLYD